MIYSLNKESVLSDAVDTNNLEILKTDYFCRPISVIYLQASLQTSRTSIPCYIHVLQNLILWKER